MTDTTAALMVVGQKRFVQTMRKAGADMKELKQVNRQAAEIALPAVRNLTPVGRTGRLRRSVRVGATQKAGIIRAGSKAVPYAGPINYGWPAHHVEPKLFANNGVASSESAWQRPYREFIDKTLNQVKGA